MAVGVRPVVASDEDAWLVLFRDYVAFYEASVPDDVIALTWRRLLGQEDNMMALIASDAKGQALGIAALVFHRSTWSPTWYCYLEDLFVAS
ncbi:MAG TPA: GNAT family N-acetyltransferase, partial [Hyphomicrobium sp.]